MVEDEEPIRLINSEYLRMNGMEIIEARDGIEALEILKKTPDINFVLLDIMLPMLDGLGVLKSIKSDPHLKDTKVYMWTVLGREDVIKKAFDEGANGFLMKDTTPENLKKEIEAALKQ